MHATTEALRLKLISIEMSTTVQVSSKSGPACNKAMLGRRAGSQFCVCLCCTTSGASVDGPLYPLSSRCRADSAF